MNDKALYCFKDLAESVKNKLIKEHLSGSITDWCWEFEGVESRINNEASTIKIKNFELNTEFHFNNDRLFSLSFDGQLRLIDVIEAIYDKEDTCFNMYDECLTVVSLSQSNKIDISFYINKSIVEYNIAIVNTDTLLTAKEQQHIDNFLDHSTLMLDIWRSSIIKKWREYYLEVFRKNNFKDIIKDELVNLGVVFLKNGKITKSITG